MIRLLLTVILLVSPRGFSATVGSEGVSIRFLAERCPSDLGQVVMSAGEHVTEPFDLPTNHLSEAWNPPARIFALRTVERKITLSTVTLPEEGKSFVILLVPTREGGFKPVAIPTDQSEFRPGNVFLYNHSPNEIVGKVGTAKFMVSPSTGTLIAPTGARKENYFDVGFYTREKSGIRPLSLTRWPVDDKVRTYVFFFVNPVKNRLDFRTVDEFIPPPATASNS